MTITTQYEKEGDRFWTVEIADDRFVDVRRSDATGNLYIIRNEGGLTVHDSAGNYFRGPSYDAYEPIGLINELLLNEVGQ